VTPTAAPVASPPSETIIVKRGGAVAYLALIVALLVLGGVAAAGYGGWRFYLQPLRDRVAALEARSGGSTGDLDARVAKLEAQISQGRTPEAAPATAATTASGGQAADANRLAAIEQQLADLKAGSAQSAQIAKGLSDLQVAAGGRELLAQSIRDIQSSTAATQGELERLSTQITADRTRLDAAEASLTEKRQ
jgi:chromosome segregation ATPase